MSNKEQALCGRRIWRNGLSGLGAVALASGVIVAGSASAEAGQETFNPFDTNHGYSVVTSGELDLSGWTSTSTRGTSRTNGPTSSESAGTEDGADATGLQNAEIIYSDLDAQVDETTAQLQALYADSDLCNRVKVKDSGDTKVLSGFATDRPNVIEYEDIVGAELDFSQAGGYVPSSEAPLIIHVSEDIEVVEEIDLDALASSSEKSSSTRSGKHGTSSKRSGSTDGDSYSGYVLFDLSEVSGSVDFDCPVKGSVWAPDADVTYSGSGESSGQTYSSSFTSEKGSGKLKHRDFEGKLPCSTDTGSKGGKDGKHSRDEVEEETPETETEIETPVEEAPAEETPAEEIPAEETPAEDTVVTPPTGFDRDFCDHLEDFFGEDEPETPVAEDETPAEETPAEETPAEEAPVTEDETPVTEDETPAEETPADETPAEETPAEETPAEETPAEETPAEETPAEETPAEETPVTEDETPVTDEQDRTEETPVADTEQESGEEAGDGDEGEQPSDEAPTEGTEVDEPEVDGTEETVTPETEGGTSVEVTGEGAVVELTVGDEQPAASESTTPAPTTHSTGSEAPAESSEATSADSGEELAKTGTNVAVPLSIAAGLLLVGGAVLMVVRSRRV
ncbi:collagen-binding domain-containing protein [Brachybacterium sp. DNPG3]